MMSEKTMFGRELGILIGMLTLTEFPIALLMFLNILDAVKFTAALVLTPVIILLGGGFIIALAQMVWEWLINKI